MEARGAFIRTINATGIKTTMSRMKMHPNENVPQNHGGGGRRYPQYQQGEITISAMIKKMNMLTFKHVAFYKGKNSTGYPKTEVMIKKMFWAEKRTRIGARRKSIADLDRQKMVWNLYTKN
ncbi:MAG: hypothetical protein ACLR6I_18960 [Waltera sp.]